MVLPVEACRMEGRFDVFEELQKSLEHRGLLLIDGDVVVISAKYVSNSEGRIINLDVVDVSEAGRRISDRFALKPQVAEVILRESDKILGGMPGFLVATSAPLLSPPVEPVRLTSTRQPVLAGRRYLSPRGMMAPNAGIDTSNVRRGSAVLYPDAPYHTAELLRRKIFLEVGVKVGVILADSRLMPARVGTSGVAVACAGIEPVQDVRSRRDLNGNPLKVTFQATADNIATIANHAMGEGSESRPFTIVRNTGATLTGRRTSPFEVVVAADQCVYVRGLAGGLSSDEDL